MKNKFFEIKNQTNESVDFYLYGDIISNTDWKWDESDVMPQDILDFVSEHEGKNINLYVNSGGGSVFAALGMKAILERAKAKGSYIKAHVDGLAASSASFLIMCADEIICPSNAFIMVHPAWSYSFGNQYELKKQADDLAKIDEGIFNTYKSKFKDGVDEEEFQALIKAETWMTGEEASKYFDIKISDQLEAVATINGDSFNRYQNKPNDLVIQDSSEQNGELTIDEPVEPIEEPIIEPQESEEEIKNKEKQELKNRLLLELELY